MSHDQLRTQLRCEVAGVKRSVHRILLCLVAVQILTPVSNAADVLSVVNTVRTQDCALSNKLVPLQRNSMLNQAASLLGSGRSPHDAAASVGYQAMQLASIHLTGYSNAAALKQVLRERYCSNLNERNLQHIGVAQRGGEIWIL